MEMPDTRCADGRRRRRIVARHRGAGRIEMKANAGMTGAGHKVRGLAPGQQKVAAILPWVSLDPQARAGIRAHRDSTGHELCWHHPALWSLLPEQTDPLPVVPAWPQFMRGCIRYRQSLDEQAPRSGKPY